MSPARAAPRAFWVVVGLMVVLGIALLGVFRWRRWL